MNYPELGGQHMNMQFNQHLLMEQQFQQELRQLAPFELWNTLQLEPSWGYSGTIDAWFEGMRSLMSDAMLRQRDGEWHEGIPIFVIGVGEPRSGKTKMLHDFALQSVIGRHPSDAHSLSVTYQEDPDLEILISNNDWGANFPVLPEGVRVPEEVDYNNLAGNLDSKQLEALRAWKRKELELASQNWGNSFFHIINRYYHRKDIPRALRRNKKIAHMILCDHPGPTGIGDAGFDRATDVLYDLIHHEGQFKNTPPYGVIMMGLVASAEVLRHNEAKRIALVRRKKGRQILADIQANGDKVLAEDERVAVETAKLYVEEAASRKELEQFLRDSEDYQIARFNQMGLDGEAIVTRHRQSLEERQKDMAKIVIPDYLESRLQVDPQKVLLLRNEVILPSVSLTSIAKHRPMRDLHRAGILPAIQAS